MAHGAPGGPGAGVQFSTAHLRKTLGSSLTFGSNAESNSGYHCLTTAIGSFFFGIYSVGSLVEFGGKEEGTWAFFGLSLPRFTDICVSIVSSAALVLVKLVHASRDSVSIIESEVARVLTPTLLTHLRPNTWCN